MAIKVYSTKWCGDCHRAKRFLESHKVEFEEINIDEDPAAARMVIERNQGRRCVPTFDIDGTFHANPPLHELEKLLGLT